MMSNILDIPVDGKMIAVMHCDFVATGTNSVRITPREVAAHRVAEVGNATIDTRRGPDEPLSGIFYLAFTAPGGDVGTMDRILCLGISTENARKYNPIKELKLDPQLTYRSSTELKDELTVAAGHEALIWWAWWGPPKKRARESIQEIMAESQGPFESSEPEKIIETAKAMEDTIVLVATVEAVQ
jgi:hypothetical protein